MSEETKTEKLKPADVEKKILELANAGHTPEKIGLILRDKHGIPKARMYGKSIGTILKEHNLYKDSENAHISAKVENLKGHFEKNKHDYSAKRSLMTNTARLYRRERRAKPVTA